MRKEKNTNRGFIKTILLVVAALVLLRYVYKFDVIGLLTQGKIKEVLDVAYKFGAEAWLRYQGIVIEILNKIKTLFLKK